MHKRMNFSTEIRETFGKQYVKVYFLDDSIAKDAKEVVERLNVIKTVNITPSARSWKYTDCLSKIDGRS